MASLGSRRGHLEPQNGREVVFCHACFHEWFREGESLQCPSCRSEITEIVENTENDPRTMHDFSFPPSALGAASPGLRRPRRNPHIDLDSDPEEDDIENLATFPGGNFIRHNVFRPQIPRREESDLGPGGDNGGMPEPDRAVFLNFRDLLLDLGAGPTAQTGSAAPRMRRTTYRAGPFTSVTITQGSMGGGDGIPDYDAIFTNILGGSPLGGPRLGDPDREEGGPPPLGGGLPATLQGLFLSLLNPQAAVRGDAVYSQEALDRIITTLMEANPQSNAAPPASEAAIERLEKKKLDDEMLGESSEGKAECTICIDDLVKGDEVTVLPCKHWFHGECVTLWLKEHNTCPICRAPIETRGGQGSGANSGPRGSADNGNNNNGNEDQSAGSRQPGPGGFSLFGSGSPGVERPSPFTWTSTITTNTSSGRTERPAARTLREAQERLDAIRNTAGRQQSSTSSRRSSASPDRPRDLNLEAEARRARVRSPSFSSSREWGGGAGSSSSTPGFGTGGDGGNVRRSFLGDLLGSQRDNGSGSGMSTSRYDYSSGLQQRNRDRDSPNEMRMPGAFANDSDYGSRFSRFYSTTSNSANRDGGRESGQQQQEQQQEQQQQQQQQGGSSSNSGHNGPLSWIRSHLSRSSNSDGADGSRRR